MKKRYLIPAAALLVIAAIGAKEPVDDKPLVELRKSYLVSNGSAAVQGEIMESLGNGWYLMRRSQRGGGEVKVNVAGSLFIQEQQD